jgi:hypothetical protein
VIPRPVHEEQGRELVGTPGDACHDDRDAHPIPRHKLGRRNILVGEADAPAHVEGS